MKPPCRHGFRHAGALPCSARGRVADIDGRDAGGRRRNGFAAFVGQLWSFGLARTVWLTWCLAAAVASAQPADGDSARLARDLLRNGGETLRAFAPVSAATRHSIVKLDVNGGTVALATVIDSQGHALTKASELKDGRLTAWLVGGREVEAQLLAVDTENDVALVKVHAEGLRPVQWATNEVVVGQWAVTPGIEALPHAVGIVSVPPRRIRHPRAFLGVQLDPDARPPKIADLLPGLGAEAAGLKPGDVILSVNDTAVADREMLVETLRRFRDGQSVQVRVRRQAQEFDVTVTLKAPALAHAERWFDRSERMNRLGGEISTRAEGFAQAIQHDTVLAPWLCGGPLVNLQGQAIGLNIARAGRVASYALSAEVAQAVAAELLRQAQGDTTEEITIQTAHPLEPSAH